MTTDANGRTGEAVLRAMRAHASVRDYTGAALPDAELERAVAAAQQASTSSNVQAYSLLRVTDPGEREALAELCGGQEQVRRAGAFCVVCGDLRRDALVARRAGAELVPNLEAFLLAVVDASLFAQNLVLALEALGHGACYVGGLRNRIAEVDALLELPDLVLPLYGLCAGEAASRNAPKPRLATDAVLHRGRYPDDDAVLAGADAYDEAMHPHFAARGKPHHTWTGAIARKFGGALRPHLWSYYRSKGIRLDLE